MKLTSYEEYCQMIENETNKQIYLSISASWCKPCQKMKIKIDEYMKMMNIKKDILLCEIDYDDMNEEWLERLDVKKVPSYYVIKNGEINKIQTADIDEWIHFMNLHEIVSVKQIEILEDF